MPRGLARKTLTLIDDAAAILDEIAPATVRGVCYKLFTRGLTPDMKDSTVAGVSRALVTARENGIIPWESIVDEHREIARRPSWADPSAYARAVQHAYRRDRWADQPRRVMVVSEKGTVRGVLDPVLKRYGVPFLVQHGFGSATSVHDLALDSGEDDTPLTLLYVGDRDQAARSWPTRTCRPD